MDQDNQKKFWKAIREEKLSIVQETLSLGADPNLPEPEDGGEYPIHRAAHHGSDEVLKLLLEAGANRYQLDGEGFSILHSACFCPVFQYGFVTDPSALPIKTVINWFENLNEVGKNGCSPLHMAATGNFTEAAKLLIERKVDLTLKDHNGRTALDIATEYKAKDFIGLILAAQEQEALAQVMRPIEPHKEIGKAPSRPYHSL